MTDLDKWGKDHWSLLAYVETCCVDDCGTLDRKRMRCNEKRHPLLKATSHEWLPTWGTILKKGTIEYHDDWDCLDDLNDAGFVNEISMINGIVSITEKGTKVAHQIRKHKADGGTFSTFKLER